VITVAFNDFPFISPVLIRTARVWRNWQPLYELKGHSQSVWAVLPVEEELFLTGLCLPMCLVLSSCLSYLNVMFVPPLYNRQLTYTNWGNPGSADKSIKLWDYHKVIQTFTGHNDAVRGLALVPDVGFASCSNDRCVFPLLYDQFFLALFMFSAPPCSSTFSRVPTPSRNGLPLARSVFGLWGVTSYIL